ncbi:MAG: RNA polymerase sigma factor RpoD/SigA [Calditrichia bacterium]|nr:RNA polymerase sigma factor RpoD/SigA [Calditrichia bacterium]
MAVDDTTKVSSNTLEQYLNEISQIELLKPNEEVTLAKQIKEGDEKALQNLVKANLRFVVKISKEYQNQGLPLSDLINEGNLGLIKAAKRFDETRGFKFISYAVWWIRQSILQAIAENSRVVRLPLNRISMINKINKILAIMEQDYGNNPDVMFLALGTDYSEKDIIEALNNSSYPLSLDSPVSNSEEKNTLKDLLENEDSDSPDYKLDIESLKIEVVRILQTLTPREELIVRLYFGINHDRPFNLEEIGERLNLTRERVRQIKERALKRLRHQSRSQFLRIFL